MKPPKIFFHNLVIRAVSCSLGYSALLLAVSPFERERAREDEHEMTKKELVKTKERNKVRKKKVFETVRGIKRRWRQREGKL